MDPWLVIADPVNDVRHNQQYDGQLLIDKISGICADQIWNDQQRDTYQEEAEDASAFSLRKKRMTAAARINNVFTIRNVLSAYDCCEMGMAISAKSSIYEWMNSKI